MAIVSKFCVDPVRNRLFLRYTIRYRISNGVDRQASVCYNKQVIEGGFCAAQMVKMPVAWYKDNCLRGTAGLLDFTKREK